MVEMIKELAKLDTTTLNEAMKRVKGTEAQKNAALKEINEYKFMREEIGKWFRK